MDIFLNDFKLNLDIFDVEYRLCNGVNVPFYKVSCKGKIGWFSPVMLADLYFHLQSLEKL